MKLSVLIVLLLSATTAAAQPALTAPQQGSPQGTMSDSTEKDPTTAVLLSIAGSAIPVALIAAGSSVDDENLQATFGFGAAIGMLVGPSLGHWYAGDYLTGGMAMRGIGGSAFVIGAAMEFGDCFLKEGCDSNGSAIMLMGGAVFVAGVVYDVATSAEAARQYNAKHARRSFQLGPTMVGAHASPGLGIAGTF